MTKDEFITGYLERSGLTEFRTANGWANGRVECIAVVCECEDELCDGWRMLSREDAMDPDVRKWTLRLKECWA